jgi:hypothetical protein
LTSNNILNDNSIFNCPPSFDGAFPTTVANDIVFSQSTVLSQPLVQNGQMDLQQQQQQQLLPQISLESLDLQFQQLPLFTSPSMPYSHQQRQQQPASAPQFMFGTSKFYLFIYLF